MDSWITFTKAYGKRSPGRLLVFPNFGESTAPSQAFTDSPKTRDLVAWLPPSATWGGGPYPLLFLLDGQNLFDDSHSHAGSWGVSSIMEDLVKEGNEVVVVGIPHAGQTRMREYKPKLSKQTHQAIPDPFLDTLVNEIAPFVENRFSIDPRRRFIGGSSMGALFGLYAFFARPGFFSGVLALSPSLHEGGQPFVEFVRQSAPPAGKIYLDTGTEEVSVPRPGIDSQRFTANAVAMSQLLNRKGYRDGDRQQFILDQDAPHSEEAWARRLPGAVRYLLRGY